MKGKTNYSVLILLIIISIFLLIYFSFYFISESRAKVVEREFMIDRFHVDQSAMNIESVLEMLSKHLLHEADFHSGKFFNSEYLPEIQKSLIMHKPYINSVTRTDSAGVILYTVPDNDVIVGTDISYQPHIKKIIKDHKPVFSDVFMSVQGYKAVALHVPIMKGDKYNGSLAYLISFDHLVDFFEDKYTDNKVGGLHLVLSNSGTVIFSKNKNETGKDIRSLLKSDNTAVKAIETFLKAEKERDLIFSFNKNTQRAHLRKISLPFGESWNILSSVDCKSILSENNYMPSKLLLLLFLLFSILTFIVFRLRTMYIKIKNREIQDHLEKNLSASQKLYKSILTDITSMVCRLNDSKKIIFFNRVFYQRFKSKTNKLKGKDIVELLNEDEALILNSKLDEISITRPIHSFEFTISMNSTEFYYYITARGIFDEKGKLSEYQLICPDITEYKLSEKKDSVYREKIKESEKMAALGNLAAGVAHDFNNILMGIQGNISILKLKYEKNQEIASRISLIEEQIKNASGLSRQLLGMAKGGKYEITKFDPNELVKSISEVFSHSNRNIVFKLVLASENFAVEGDKSQIRQALTNITLNAIQSINDTGEIDIKTEFVQPDEDFLYTHSLKKQKYFKFTVRDNGEGMDEEIQTKIFDPFFTTKKKGKGSGLGLASAYGIVRNHDGILLFESEKFVGSIFYLYLPVREPAGSSENVQDNCGSHKGNETILIVDDEKMVLNATADMLSYLGYKPLKAENGKIALDIFKNNSDISCVILDMILPGMDGEKIFIELRKINPNVRVLISSGYSMSKKVEAMLISGAKGFLEKPFSMEELSKKIKAVIESK